MNDSITPRQKRAIKFIKMNTKGKYPFTGCTREDASDFISKHLAESKQVRLSLRRKGYIK